MPATLDADATLELLDRLDDPSDWAAVKRGVPVFKLHAGPKRDSKGQVRQVQVNEADLHRIARRTNERLTRTGTPVSLWADHRDLAPGAKAADQPPLVGYAKDFRVGTFGPQSETAILADFYILPEHYDLARESIYRSVDYYPASGDIDGVALMKRRPHLDLGVVQFRRPGEPYLQYAFPDDDGDADDAAAPEAPDAPPAPEAAAPAGPSPDWVKNFEMYLQTNPGLAAAIQSFASGAPPMPAAPAPAPTMPLPDEVQQMRHDQMAVQYARLEGKVKELEGKLAAQRTAAERSRCEQYVTQLEAEGYQLDRAVEVDVLTPLSAERRQSRLSYIRKHYKQEAPLAAPVPYSLDGRVPVAAALATGQPTDAEADKVIQYRREHPEVSFEAALAKLRAN